MPTQSTDKIVAPGADGIDFQPTDGTWTIDPGILVYAPALNGVFSGQVTSTLINDGGRIIGAENGAWFNADGGVVSNSVAGAIIGGDGLLMAGNDAGVDNR